MNKHYDGIDIFFIITISFYFIILFLFVSTFILGYFEVIYNDYFKHPIKITKPKIEPQEIPKVKTYHKIYKSNISYLIKK